MNYLLFREKPSNIYLWFLVGILAVVGLLAVFATTYPITDSVSELFYKQILFYILGISLILFISHNHYYLLFSKVAQLSFITINFLLLISVLISGTTINGATRWIDLEWFLFQPAEISKVIIIIVLADILVRKVKDRRDIAFKFFQLFSIGTTIILIFQQNSLGNTIILLAIISIMLFSILPKNSTFIRLYSITSISITLYFLSTINGDTALLGILFGLCAALLGAITISFFRRPLLLLSSLGVFIAPIILIHGLIFSYNELLEPYQQERLESFIFVDESNDSWNRDQSILAVGSGQVVGEGFLQCKQVNFGLLPFPYTDFVFACISQQFGFVGAVASISIYFLLINEILQIGYRGKSNESKILSIGIAGFIFIHVFQHIGMNIGILPITGVTLPFVSYGGSSIIAFATCFGIMQSIHKNHYQQLHSVTKVTARKKNLQLK